LKKLLLTVAMLLATSCSVSAKLTTLININASDEQLKHEVRESIEARLNSTERYKVAHQGDVPDLEFDVSCMALETEGGSKTGIGCYSEITYYPFRDSLYTDLPGTFVVAGHNSGEYIANQLVNNFINGSTDELLTNSKNMLKVALLAHCVMSPDDCKLQ
jgi:hypothetical protein